MSIENVKLFFKQYGNGEPDTGIQRFQRNGSPRCGGAAL